MLIACKGVVHAGPASTPRGVVQGLACEFKSPLPLWLWHLAGLRPFAAAAPLQQGPSPKEPWQRRERRNGINSFELNSSSCERSRGTPLSDGLRRLFVKSTSQCDFTNYKCKTNEHQCFGGMLEGRLSSIPLVVANSLVFFAGEPSHGGAFFPFGVTATRRHCDRVHQQCTARRFVKSRPLCSSCSVPSIKEGLRPAVWGSSRRPCQHPSRCGARVGLRI